MRRRQECHGNIVSTVMLLLAAVITIVASVDAPPSPPTPAPTPAPVDDSNMSHQRLSSSKDSKNLTRM
jgi:hypothetical protein